MIRYLSLEQLPRIADAAIEGDVVVRDGGLLESALARPQTTLFGEDAYPDLYTKAAALLHTHAGNHALIDGDERLAFAAPAVFLDINGTRFRLHDLVGPLTTGGRATAPGLCSPRSDCVGTRCHSGAVPPL